MKFPTKIVLQLFDQLFNILFFCVIGSNRCRFFQYQKKTPGKNFLLIILQNADSRYTTNIFNKYAFELYITLGLCEIESSLFGAGCS